MIVTTAALATIGTALGVGVKSDRGGHKHRKLRSDNTVAHKIRLQFIARGSVPSNPLNERFFTLRPSDRGRGKEGPHEDREKAILRGLVIAPLTRRYAFVRDDLGHRDEHYLWFIDGSMMTLTRLLTLFDGVVPDRDGTVPIGSSREILGPPWDIDDAAFDAWIEARRTDHTLNRDSASDTWSGFWEIDVTEVIRDS